MFLIFEIVKNGLEYIEFVNLLQLMRKLQVNEEYKHSSLKQLIDKTRNSKLSKHHNYS